MNAIRGRRAGSVAIALAAAAACAGAAEWPWSAEVTTMVSPETGGHPRAFLWIPPDGLRVRAVVVGQHNMEEEPLLEHPRLRAAMARLGLAAVWVTPPIDPAFRVDRGAGRHFDAMMTALADESGYAEIATAPVVPIGHSAAASYPWAFAAWRPGRTLAAISVSGQWPFWSSADHPAPAAAALDGVPGLVTMGEYEWAEDRAGEGLKQRRAHPRVPLSMLAEPGAGHFDISEAKVAFLAAYLEAACAHRLGDGARPNGLRSLDPAAGGWLVDRWRGDDPPRAPAAPVADYRGDRAEAFWCFDEAHARLTGQAQAAYRGRKVALAGYLQDGAAVPQVAGTHPQVTIPFVPADDGLTFKLTGAFLDVVPAGRPEKWTGLPAGSPVGRPAGGGPISIDRICGPVEKLSADTFAVRFDRMGMDNRKRTPEIWLAATHPGDDVYRRSVQQALLRIPLRNEAGRPQRIDFPQPPDVAAGTRALRLTASADSGEKVRFYVLSGPAEVDGDILRLSQPPPRSRLPIKVTVVAWQWGRSVEPKLRTAEPVTRTFRLTATPPASAPSNP